MEWNDFLWKREERQRRIGSKEQVLIGSTCPRAVVDDLLLQVITQKGKRVEVPRAEDDGIDVLFDVTVFEVQGAVVEGFEGRYRW